MAMSYECWAYVNGKPEKMVHVTAESKGEAERLAAQKFQQLGVRYESINCK